MIRFKNKMKLPIYEGVIIAGQAIEVEETSDFIV